MDILVAIKRTKILSTRYILAYNTPKMLSGHPCGQENGSIRKGKGRKDKRGYGKGGEEREGY